MRRCTRAAVGGAKECKVSDEVLCFLTVLCSHELEAGSPYRPSEGRHAGKCGGAPVEHLVPHYEVPSPYERWVSWRVAQFPVPAPAP